MMVNKVVILMVFGAMAATAAFAAETASVTRPTIAKICTNCHKTEPGAVRGNFDLVSFKAKTIQVKIDEGVELFTFDEDEIKVINGAGKTGDGEFLKDNLIKKRHEIKVEYTEKNGVKTAVKLIEKPPVQISEDMLMKTADMEKLVALGPEKGKYFLFDSRPLPRFQEGYIPTAVNLPYPAFDKLAEKLLPKDKNALIIFYCSGPSCNMSPGSADKAKKLGYTNIKVYKDGMPAWSTRNYAVLPAQYLKEAWLDKDIPLVVLDVRPAKEAAKGSVKGAVSFPAHHNAAPLVKKLDQKLKKAPIVVIDDKGGVQAVAVAKELLKAGFGNVKLLSGGFNAWKSARYEVVAGKLTTETTYTPKPRPGEIALDEFKKYAAELPANVMIIDARSAGEARAGMLKTAKLIPAEEIKNRLAEIPKDKLIVFYCNTGVIAEVAYNILKGLGYGNVKFVSAKVDFDKNGAYSITNN